MGFIFVAFKYTNKQKQSPIASYLKPKLIKVLKTNSWSWNGVLIRSLVSQLPFVSNIAQLVCVQHRPSGSSWGHGVFIHKLNKSKSRASSASTARISASRTPCSWSQYRWHDPVQDGSQEKAQRFFTVTKWSLDIEKLTEIIPQRPHTRWLQSVYLSMLWSMFSTSSASGSSPAR
jgi:hypothetical protein